MGQLDQFAKQMFAEETVQVTHGALAWLAPPEIGLSEVRLDGLLRMLDPSALSPLLAPWSEARGHDEIVLEIKMQGDHLDFPAIERALLRRQAREVQRAEDESAAWQGQEPLWLVAAHKPAVLSQGREVTPVAPGCYRVGPGVFDFLWIAANELPLAEELVPFLIARTGRALDDFARWVALRRSPAWLWRMVQIVPMSTSMSDELSRYFIQTDEPEIRARQRRLAEIMVKAYPEVNAALVEQSVERGVAKGLERGLEQGLERGLERGLEQGLGPLLHQFERKLGRKLGEDEHRVLHDRLTRLGPDRLGDVVLDLPADALAVWLADPAAQ